MLPYQLADDVSTYGDKAGWWIITTDDYETEIGSRVYETYEQCVEAIERKRSRGLPLIYWRVTLSAGGFVSGAFDDLKTFKGALRRIEREYPDAREWSVALTPEAL